MADNKEVPSEAGPSRQPAEMADNKEVPSEAGPSRQPPISAAVEDEKKRRRRRKERLKPREKKIVLLPRPATADRGVMQLLDTMNQRGIGGRGNPVYVIEKKLTESDADINQCRLQLTPAFVDSLLASQFLTREELNNLRPGKEGLDVKAVDRENNEYDLNLRRCSSLNQYRILNWSQFIVDHDLRKGLKIKIWVFRWRSNKEDDDGKIGTVILYYDETDEHDERQQQSDAQLLDGRIIDAMNGLLKLEAQRGDNRSRA